MTGRLNRSDVFKELCRELATIGSGAIEYVFLRSQLRNVPMPICNGLLGFLRNELKERLVVSPISESERMKEMECCIYSMPELTCQRVGWLEIGMIYIKAILSIFGLLIGLSGWVVMLLVNIYRSSAVLLLDILGAGIGFIVVLLNIGSLSVRNICSETPF